MKQPAKDEKSNYPEAAVVISNDTDSGRDDIPSVQKLQNCNAILQQIPVELNENKTIKEFDLA